MQRSVVSTLFVSFFVALLLSQTAAAATYNFYFPKHGGAPEVELADDEASASDSNVLAEEDETPVYVPAPVVRSSKRYVVKTPLPSAVPYCAQGTTVIPPVVIYGRSEPESTTLVEPTEEQMTGQNTTAGHTLQPRRRVVKRTILIER